VVSHLDDAGNREQMRVIVEKILGWIQYNATHRIKHTYEEKQVGGEWQVTWPARTLNWLRSDWDRDTRMPDDANTRLRKASRSVT